MGKAAAKEVSLPQAVFVTRETDGDDSWLWVAETPGDFKTGQVVGVYELRRTTTARVVVE